MLYIGSLTVTFQVLVKLVWTKVALTMPVNLYLFLFGSYISSSSFTATNALSADVIKAYMNSCARLRVKPIDKLIKQLKVSNL